MKYQFYVTNVKTQVLYNCTVFCFKYSFTKKLAVDLAQNMKSEVVCVFKNKVF